MRTFKSFLEWWQYAMGAAVDLTMALWRVTVAIVMGVVSLFLALWRQVARLVGSYPNIALGAFLVALTLAWLLTFVSMRARAVGAEARLGLVSYEYQTFKEQHGYE